MLFCFSASEINRMVMTLQVCVVKEVWKLVMVLMARWFLSFTK